MSKYECYSTKNREIWGQAGGQIQLKIRDRQEMPEERGGRELRHAGNTKQEGKLVENRGEWKLTLGKRFFIKQEQISVRSCDMVLIARILVKSI